MNFRDEDECREYAEEMVEEWGIWSIDDFVWVFGKKDLSSYYNQKDIKNYEAERASADRWNDKWEKELIADPMAYGPIVLIEDDHGKIENILDGYHRSVALFKHGKEVPAIIGKPKATTVEAFAKYLFKFS